MVFKELQATSDALEKKKIHSSMYCEEAYQIIARAQENNFTNRKQLQKAVKLFIQALRRYREQAEPLIGLGYIHILISDFQGAQKFLKQALNIEPDNQSARELMDYTHQPFIPEKAVDELTADDFDELYDEAEAKIVLLLQRVLKFPTENPPTLDTLELDAHFKEFGEVMSDFEELQNTFAILEIEFDIGELRIKVKPLEKGIVRQQKYMRTSREFQATYKDILVTMKKITASTKAVQEENLLADIEGQLHSFMDDCDRLADRLDAFDEQGINITPLEKTYEMIIQAVEQLQFTLDGKLQLKSKMLV